MASGTLNNMSTSAFVATPRYIAERIVQHLLRIPSESINVIDPTIGEGDLLAPLRTVPTAQLVGVEISAERLAVARDNLPDAQLIGSAFEAVRITPGSMGLVLCNPPYFTANGHRAEYSIIRDAGELLQVDGIMVAIIPARSAWDGLMINHWLKHYDDIRCWKVDDTEFDKYTQIVVVGRRLATPRTQTDDAEKRRLAGWRWRQPKKADESPWGNGTPPDELPTMPIADPYPIPAAETPPDIVVLKADDATLLQGLLVSGAHTTPAWHHATAWVPDRSLERPLMPIAGPMHLGALILTGLFDGEAHTGPDGSEYVFATQIATEWVAVPISEEQQQKHITSIIQQQDKAVLAVLNLQTGEIAQYQRDQVFEFLTPWLPILAAKVMERYTPLYDLNPQDWMLQVASSVCQDKGLPGAPFKGLQVPQLHRVFAMWESLCAFGRCAIQGEPGTGKTRQHIVLMALFAHVWKHRQQWPTKLPSWVKRVRRAWKHNPQTRGDAPTALPLAVVTPKRVIPVWAGEISAAWPEAEVVIVSQHQDIRQWMERCAESTAPAVIAIISQSSTRAFGRQWRPAVLERQETVTVPDLKPSADLLPTLEEIRRDGRLVAYATKGSGTILMKETILSSFFCPDCGALQQAVPGRLRQRKSPDRDAAEGAATEADSVEPIRSLTWFEHKPRTCCACDAPLWTDARIMATDRKYPQIPFAAWSQAVATHPEESPTTPAKRTRRSLAPLVRMVDATGRRGPAAPDSFSPYAYWLRFYPGCAAFVEIDESHNARSKSTDIARSIHQAQRAAQTYGYGSGTHYGGLLTDFFFYWFRYNPQFWLKLGLGWDDAEEAVSRYGIIQTITKEFESSARRGSGQTDISISTVPAPGISTRLLPYLLADMAFIDVLDVGAFMPPREELPIIVPMDDPDLDHPLAHARLAYEDAEAHLRDVRAVYEATITDPYHTLDEQDSARNALTVAECQLVEAQRIVETTREWREKRNLAEAYRRVEGTLEAMAQNRNEAARLAKGTVPRWWAILPFVDDPKYTVTETYRDDWGDVERIATIFEAPVLHTDHVYPLERRLRDLLREELAQQRVTMVYFEQNAVRSTANRLCSVLADLVPWVLPNNVDAEDREDAINAAIDNGAKVLLVPYLRVLEGLNLQKAKTIIWYEMPKSLFHLDQASRRSWRLGQTELVRLYYMAYAGSAGHKQMLRLGSRSGAAAAFAGGTPDGELAKQAGADKTTLAKLGAGLEQSEDIDLDAVFKRRGEELAAKLKEGRTWIGATDRLADRLAAHRRTDSMRLNAPPSEQWEPELTHHDQPPTDISLPTAPSVMFGDLAHLPQRKRKRSVVPPDQLTLW